MIKPEQLEAATKRWPHIGAALHPDSAYRYMNEWCKNNDPNEHGPEELKEALRLFLLEKFKSAPPEEIADALAEYYAASIINNLIDKLKDGPTTPESFAA